MLVIDNDIIAMAPAFESDNTYYIFRSTRDQVEIKIKGDFIFGTSHLTANEMKHISLNYPWIDILKYRVTNKFK